MACAEDLRRRAVDVRRRMMMNFSLSYHFP